MDDEDVPPLSPVKVTLFVLFLGGLAFGGYTVWRANKAQTAVAEASKDYRKLFPARGQEPPPPEIKTVIPLSAKPESGMLLKIDDEMRPPKPQPAEPPPAVETKAEAVVAAQPPAPAPAAPAKPAPKAFNQPRLNQGGYSGMGGGGIGLSGVGGSFGGGGAPKGAAAPAGAPPAGAPDISALLQGAAAAEPKK
ncbi:MAG: hypothetical protein M0D55_02820 [Elusimicrobiota bacterium]|nr:MAG: hypothetical protein M0D55_02820 [Elusimicrobiota bacterium]